LNQRILQDNAPNAGISTKGIETRTNLSVRCHCTEMADYVAALNIVEVAVNQPIIASVFTTVTSHPALADGR
jgi:hypothetical protein